MDTKLVFNAIRCNKCKNIVVSNHTHDFRTCECGTVSVDGGLDYRKRCGNKSDYTDISMVMENDRLYYVGEQPSERK